MTEPGAPNIYLEKKNEKISREKIEQSIQEHVLGVLHRGTFEDYFSLAREIAAGRVWIGGSPTRNETIQQQVREYLTQASEEDIQNVLQQPMEQAYRINYSITGELSAYHKDEIQKNITGLARMICMICE